MLMRRHWWHAARYSCNRDLARWVRRRKLYKGTVVLTLLANAGNAILYFLGAYNLILGAACAVGVAAMFYFED